MTKQDFISHGITMKKQDKLYDVYVSYPPDVDRERINACLYDNLPEKEAEDLVQALAERPQAIIAENCTQDERENAQQYFNYLGLDVIVRQSMELELDLSGEEQEEAAPEIRQCPVCLTLIEDVRIFFGLQGSQLRVFAQLVAKFAFQFRTDLFAQEFFFALFFNLQLMGDFSLFFMLKRHPFLPFDALALNDLLSRAGKVEMADMAFRRLVILNQG